MKRIGIMPEDWDALSARRSVTLKCAPFEYKGKFEIGERLTVGKLFQAELAEVTVERVGAFDERNGFELEVSGFRMLPILAYGGYFLPSHAKAEQEGGAE